MVANHAADFAMTATFHTHVDRATSTVSADILPRALWMAQVAKSVLTSPLIVCVIIGLLCNVLFHDFLPASSVEDMMTVPYEAGADGVLLWGHPDGKPDPRSSSGPVYFCVSVRRF